MKHVRIVTKDVPTSAYWWTWIGPFGELKIGGSSSPKAAYISALWNMIGSLDPRDL